MELLKQLSEIQQKLNVPKNQYNSFGGYNFRSCEDILNALKPLLNGLILTLNDDLVLIGERYYIKATATISDGTNSISASSFAREEEQLKGMNTAQITGSTSSYARKYALNALFCIDDVKEPDSTNKHGKEESEETKSNKIKCPKCGGIHKEYRHHDTHEYICENCGYRANDDLTGARNIYLLGTMYVSGVDKPRFKKLNLLKIKT